MKRRGKEDERRGTGQERIRKVGEDKKGRTRIGQRKGKEMERNGRGKERKGKEEERKRKKTKRKKTKAENKDRKG